MKGSRSDRLVQRGAVRAPPSDGARRGDAVMVRLNLVLLALAIACALGTVAAQHQARKLFVTLEKEQERSKQLENEFRQLQLEVSTWGMQARIERIAAAKLRMQALTPDRIQMLVPAEQVAAR